MWDVGGGRTLKIGCRRLASEYQSLIRGILTMRILVPVALCLGLPSFATAQSRPDLTGNWVRTDSAEQRSVAAVGDATFRVGNMGSGWGSPLTIRQEANRLIVEYAHFGTYDLQPKLALSFSLDGSESRTTIMIGHAESVLRSRATWRDSSLVITTIYSGPAPIGSTEVRQVLTLESPTSLIVETTRAGASGSAPAVLRTTYRKN